MAVKLLFLLGHQFWVSRAPLRGSAQISAVNFLPMHSQAELPRSPVHCCRTLSIYIYQSVIILQYTVYSIQDTIYMLIYFKQSVNALKARIIA